MDNLTFDVTLKVSGNEYYAEEGGGYGCASDPVVAVAIAIVAGLGDIGVKSININGQEVWLNDFLAGEVDLEAIAHRP